MHNPDDRHSPLTIRQALAENYKERRRLCQQARREREADVRVGLTKKQQQVALRILVVTKCNHNAAALWIIQPNNFNGCERKDIHSKYSDFLKDTLNSDWASAIRSMRDQESIEQQGHNIRVAKSFVQGAPLAQWVRQQHVDKGLAPPSRHILQQMESSDRMACIAADSGSPLPVMPPLASVVTGLDLEPLISIRCNKRVQRWRRKWNVRLSKIRGRETPSMSEITKKVPRRPPKK